MKKLISLGLTVLFLLFLELPVEIRMTKTKDTAENDTTTEEKTKKY